MDKILQKPALAVSLLILMCGYLFFFQLGSLALTDPDETFYAQTAKEMAAKDEWITPYLYGKPQFEKPILFYWLVEASYKIFGVNEFAARLPSAVFGIIGVIFTYFLGGIFFSRRASFLSALALGTCVEYIILSRACITDMVLTACLAGGFLFFFYGYTRQRTAFYLLSAAFFALAVLTKGPIYLLLAALTVFVFLLINKDLRALLKMPLWQMTVVFAAVSVPWYVAIYRLHGQAFVDVFFGFHNVNRFLEAEHKIGSQFYYNIPIILGGLFPWSAFLPVGLWQAAKGSLAPGAVPVSGERKGLIFVLSWFAVIFVFFTASSTKLPTYVFPCFISLALVIGWLLDRHLDGNAVPGVKTSYYLLQVLILAAAFIAPIALNKKYQTISYGAAVSAAFLVFGMFLSLAAFLRKRFFAAFVLIACAVMIFLYPVDQFVMPPIEKLESSDEVGRRLKLVMKPSERLGSESNYLAGLAFYADKAPANLDKHHDMVQFMNSDERVWVVMKEKNHIQLYDMLINKQHVKPSYLIYKSGKRAIVTNEMPRDGKYITRRERP